jgi:hypothetical protein
MGGRIFLGDDIEHEIERGDEDEAPNGGDPENDFGELHGASCRLPGENSTGETEKTMESSKEGHDISCPYGKR